MDYHLAQAILIIVSKIFFTVAAIVFLNSASVGYSIKEFNKFERMVLGVTGVLLFYPHLKLNIVTFLIGSFFFFRDILIRKFKTT